MWARQIEKMRVRRKGGRRGLLTVVKSVGTEGKLVGNDNEPLIQLPETNWEDISGAYVASDIFHAAEYVKFTKHDEIGTI